MLCRLVPDSDNGYDMQTKRIRIPTIMVIVIAMISIGFHGWQRRRLLMWNERKAELLAFTRTVEPRIGKWGYYHE